MQDTRTSHSPYARIAPRPARRAALLLGLAMLAASCAAPPPKPVVTPVSLSLVASSDANPDARGRASPLTVRVYVLKAPGPFEGADFFSLYDKDQATLGAEMVKREELLLKPGETRKLEFTLEPDAKKARELARPAAQMYMTLPNYRNNWLRMGLTEADLANGGSDRFIDATFAHGTIDAIKARIKEHFDAGASQVCIQPVNPNGKFGDLHWEVLEGIAA